MPVSHPEIFWFGTRGDVNRFADPADGRYDGAVELRWDRMVEPLTRITDAIRAGDWANRADGDSVVPVEISGLTLDEESTILDLFSGRAIEVRLSRRVRDLGNKRASERKTGRCES